VPSQKEVVADPGLSLDCAQERFRRESRKSNTSQENLVLTSVNEGDDDSEDTFVNNMYRQRLMEQAEILKRDAEEERAHLVRSKSLDQINLKKRNEADDRFHSDSDYSLRGSSSIGAYWSESEEEVEIPPTKPIGTLCKPTSGLWVAGYSQSGFYPDDDQHLNQDRVSIKIRALGTKTHLLTVLDGHGPEGHHVAEFVTRTLPDLMSKQLIHGPKTSPSQTMSDAYVAVEAQLNTQPIDTRFSGTTAVCAWVNGTQLHVANTGDSRAVIGRMGKKGQIEAYDVSQDQTPFRKDEKSRVESCGARILTSGEIHGDVTYESTDEYTADDPPRCYLQEHAFPGTAFTRSIGDQVAARIGVIATPETIQYEIGVSDRMLILASDGIWEFISSQEAVDLIKDCKDPKEACLKLIDAAWALWLTEDVRSDDISVVVAFLDSKQMAASLQKPIDNAIFPQLVGV